MAESTVLQIDFGDTAKQINQIKEETAALATENERLKKTVTDNTQAAEENAKAITLNESKIRTLNAEKKTLTRLLDNEVKQQKAATGSIEANRLKLSQLTAEYIKLAKPTAEQTKRIKDLSDRLKEQEGAIGNTSRNVGNYGEAIENATKGIKIFGVDVGGVIGNLKEKQEALSAVTSGIGGTTKGLQVMRAALISTGIGALVVALGLLINAFLSTQKGMDALNKVLLPAQRIFVEMGEVLEDLAVKGFDRLVEAFKNPKQALIDLGVIIQENLLNRIKAFAVAGGGLVQLMKGDWKEGFKTLGNSFIQLNTGIENGIEKLQAFGEAAGEVINKAVGDGLKIEALTKKIKESERDLALSRDEQLEQLAELKLAAADQTKSEEEKLKILTQAEALRRKIGREDIELARQRVELFELENAGDMDLIETQTELNKLKAEEKKINREVAEDLKRITSQRTGIIQEEIERIKKSEATIKDALAKAKDESLKIQLDRDKEYFAQQEQLAKASYQTQIEAAGNNDLLKEQAARDLADNLATIKQQELESQIEILDEFGFEVAAKESELANLKADNEIAARERNFEHQQDIAERIKELNAELLQAEYDVQNAKVDIARATLDIIESFAKEDSELARAVFLAQKVVAIAEVVVNAQRGFAAIAANLAAVPPVIGVVPNPLYPVAFGVAAQQKVALGIQTGISIATIGAQAVKGLKFAEGGEVNVGGKPHSQGGTTYVGEDGNAFEVERGEKIFVMKTTASEEMDRYSKWNQLFGGKAWTKQTRYAALGGEIPGGKKYVNRAFAPSFDGGLSAREASANIDRNVKNIPQPIVRVSEINRVQRGTEQSVQVSEL